MSAVGKHFTLCMDLMSQPCRALFVFSKLNRLHCTIKPVLIHKGQHLMDEFRKINPAAKIPVLIEDDGWVLPERYFFLLPTT